MSEPEPTKEPAPLNNPADLKTPAWAQGDDPLDTSVRAFLHATASKTPTPGGGSVAALAGTLAASLAQMTVHYTLGKKQFEGHRAELESAVDKLRKASGLMQDLIQEDMAAFQALSEVLKVPEPQRRQDARFAPAVAASVQAPRGVAGLSMYVLETCQGLLDKTNPLLVSDLGIAAALAHATVHAADLNVLVNLRLLSDRAEANDMRQKMKEITLKADVIWHQVRDHMDACL